MHSIGTILEIAEEHGMHLEWCESYAEYEGCDQPECGVVFGDWNNKTRWDEETRTHVTVDNAPSRIFAILEHMGYACEWHDEWSRCDECGKAVRTSPDCHCWLPQYKIFNDCGIVCKECILNDVEEYAETLEDNPESADTLDINWNEYGYTRLDEEYETGFHPGQDDDPNTVAEILRAAGVSRYLFEISGSGQFDITWVVWVHEDDLDAALSAMQQD